MEKLKLGYDTVREINPRIIYSSTSGIHQPFPLTTSEKQFDTHYLQATDQQGPSPIEQVTT
jgi:crotonobetainyl-CoA:carnitine CoA-transferase CaiB-like acyl-CoA transferase